MRIAAWWRMIRCGLGGHELIRHFAPRRVYLGCLHCPYETPGWEVGRPKVDPKSSVRGAQAGPRTIPDSGPEGDLHRPLVPRVSWPWLKPTLTA